MSHATVLIAVDDCPKKLVGTKVDWNMVPFEENGMFSDGSRWDWYIIGGRWNGLLNPNNMVQVKDLPPELKDKGFPVHYAFLRNRQWHEGERMGWFGGTIASECELATKKKPKRCLYKHADSGASVVVWNEDDKTWGEKFYSRFIKSLPPTTWLVTVDYHV